MKPLFNIPIKTLLFVIIALLILNAFILLSGGIWHITKGESYAKSDIIYKINKITGTTYGISVDEQWLINLEPLKEEKEKLSPEEWLKQHRDTEKGK
jgi:hypothetical protein